MDYYIEISTTTDRRATIACAELQVPDGNKVKVYHAHGSSRRVKGDTYDSVLGDTLAIQRAVQDIVHQLRRDTKARIAAMEK